MDNHGTALDRSGEPVPVPRVVGEIKRRHAVQVRDVEFLREHASPEKKIKITVPGPFTMSQQAQDDYYGDGEALAVAYAGAVVPRTPSSARSSALSPYCRALSGRACMYGSSSWTTSTPAANRSLISSLTAPA